jgi:hypothetical protein
MDRDPWKQQEGESAREYLYFQVYLEKEYLPKYKREGLRTVKGVASFMGVDPEDVAPLAKRWKWEERAREFDLTTLGKRMRGEVETPEELKLRRRKLLSANLDMLEETLSLVRAQVAAGQTPKMDLAKLLDVTLHYQDRALEEMAPVEKTLGESWDLSGLSEAEFTLLESLQNKARKK